MLKEVKLVVSRLMMILSVGVISNVVLAEEADNNYVRCTPITLSTQGKSIVLSGKTTTAPATIFFIENISHQTIRLDHTSTKNPHANAGWGSNIQETNWSALMLDKPDFALTCARVDAKGRDIPTNCVQAISVCSADVQLSPQAANSYWMAEDGSWDDIMHKVLSRLKK